MNDKNALEQVAASLQEEKFLESQLKVSVEDYRQAIETLMKVAMRDTGQSCYVAQVLLGLHNGNNFHVNLTDLCGLDTALFSAVLIAVRGRVMLMKEPHEVISDGENRFKALWLEWESLRIQNRYNSHYQ